MSLSQQYGPWAIVTGASSGIGRAIAVELARAGLQLVLIARREDALRELAESLPGEHHVLPLDLAAPDALASLRAELADRDVGLLVHAAGYGLGGAHHHHAVADHHNMMRVNCVVTLDLIDHLLPSLYNRRSGGVVLVGSAIGFCGVPWSAHYAASKAWVITLAEGLAIEARQHGVNVVAIAPGPANTGFFDRAGMTAGVMADPNAIARVTVRRLGARATVLPDWLGWAIAWSLATAPRRMRVWIMSQIMAGMTAKAA